MYPYEKYYHQMNRNLNSQHLISSEARLKKQKTEEAAKNHAEAEKIRRAKINSHYQTLRELLNLNTTSKTVVKAVILAEAVRQVKALKKRAVEAGFHQDEDGWFNGKLVTSSLSMFPGECDKATICPLGNEKDNMVKVVLCCKHMRSLNQDLNMAIQAAGAKTVKAKMSTIGDRTATEIVVRWPEGGEGDEEKRSLRRALKTLVDNRNPVCHELDQFLGVNGFGRLDPERPFDNRIKGIFSYQK